MVGETFAAVSKARKQLKVTWRAGLPGDAIDTDKDLQTYLGDGRDPKRVGVEWKSKGDAPKAIAGAAKRARARVSQRPCLSRADGADERDGATCARDGVEIWVGTQAPTRTQLDVAKALGTTPEQVQGQPACSSAAASAGARPSKLRSTRRWCPRPWIGR